MTTKTMTTATMARTFPTATSACLFLAITVLLGACSSSELRSVRVAPGDTPVATGARYHMTYTQFKVTVTRRASCTAGEGGHHYLGVDYAMTASSSEVADPLRYYVLDLASPQGFFKSTDVTVTYHDNGAVKSINATGEDRTGEFLAATAKALVKVVGGAAAKKADLKDPSPRCDQALVARLASAEALESSIEQGTARVEVLTKRLVDQTAVGTALGQGWNEASRRIVARTMQALQQEVESLERLNARLKVVLATLSHTQTVHWPEHGEIFSSGATPTIAALTGPDIAKWLADGAHTGNPGGFDDLARSTGLYFMIRPLGPDARRQPFDPLVAFADDKPEGFKYRVPANGQLEVCNTAMCAPKAVATADPGPVSQLGHVYTLPLKTALFSNKTIAATFNEQGMPLSLGMKSGAASDKAGALLGDLADLKAAVDKSKSERELADVQAKTKLLTARKEYEDAVKASLPPGDTTVADRTAAFKSDTALMEAETANFAARQALDDARRAAAAAGG